MGQTLRPYQTEALRQIVKARQEGARRVLLVMPTGSGKTSLFTSLLEQSKGARGLILVHRRELADQACNRLREYGVDFGLIMAEEPRRPQARVQVATVQTLIKRKAPPATVVIADEAHLSAADSWTSILNKYPDAFILGVTATPWRLGGAPLSGSYDRVVVGTTSRELREQGHLCDYTGFSYKTPDLSAVKTTGGDYNQGQSSAAMRQPQIVADVVERWIEFASDRSTLVFATTVEHSKELTAQFRAAGVTCEHLDGTTPLEARRAILARVEAGTTKVLCNVGVAVEGLDIPRIKCVVLARPTKSLARYIQMIGRGRRPWGGLTLRIHDHTFNIKTHGLPDDPRDYSLHTRREEPPSLTMCKKCHALYAPGEGCPFCLTENVADVERRAELVEAQEAELFTFDSGTEATEVYQPPVNIAWGQCREGRQFEGVYTAVTEERTDYGPRKRHTVKALKRTYSLQGTKKLDALLARVGVGKTVRVTYRGQQREQGAAWFKGHDFTVEADDPEEASRRSENMPLDPRFAACRSFCEQTGRLPSQTEAGEAALHSFIQGGLQKRSSPERNKFSTGLVSRFPNARDFESARAISDFVGACIAQKQRPRATDDKYARAHRLVYNFSSLDDVPPLSMIMRRIINLDPVLWR